MASGTTFETRFCTQCGTALPVEELARFGDRYVCPNCKDTFTQQLREGVVPAAEGQFAGFWIRVAATLIDAAILIPVNLVLQMLLVPAAAVDVEGNPAGFLGAMALANLLVLSYFVVGFDREKRGLHDMIVDTRVVRRS